MIIAKIGLKFQLADSPSMLLIRYQPGSQQNCPIKAFVELRTLVRFPIEGIKSICFPIVRSAPRTVPLLLDLLFFGSASPAVIPADSSRVSERTV
jgi:hypothetical protein